MHTLLLPRTGNMLVWRQALKQHLKHHLIPQMKNLRLVASAVWGCHQLLLLQLWISQVFGWSFHWLVFHLVGIFSTIVIASRMDPFSYIMDILSYDSDYALA